MGFAPGLYVVERKTAGIDVSLGSPYWRKLTLDVQIATYLDGAEAIGFKCAGVLYDVLRKPMHRPSSKGETPTEYGERVLRAIVEDVERYYQRGVIVRLQDERYENAIDRWQTAGAIREARRLKIFPKNGDSCMQWSRECDYLPICCGEADADDPVRYRVEATTHPELDAAPASELEELTQSSLRTYRACPRRYFYRYEKRLRPLKEDAAPLLAGKSIHAALEEWSRTGGDVQAALAALKSEDAFDRARESAMILGYHLRWEDDPIRFVAVEKEFECPLVNPESGAASRTFKLRGRMDGICEVTS